MYYMANVLNFSSTMAEVVNKRYTMIQCYRSKEMLVKDILQKFDVTAPDLYKYLKRFNEYGKVGLQNLKRGSKIPHNKISEEVETQIVNLHKNYPFLSSYEMSELKPANPRTIQRIQKKHGLRKIYKHKREKKTILNRLKKELVKEARRKQKNSQKEH